MTKKDTLCNWPLVITIATVAGIVMYIGTLAACSTLLPEKGACKSWQERTVQTTEQLRGAGYVTYDERRLVCVERHQVVSRAPSDVEK